MIELEELNSLSQLDESNITNNIISFVKEHNGEYNCEIHLSDDENAPKITKLYQIEPLSETIFVDICGDFGVLLEELDYEYKSLILSHIQQQLI